MHQLDPETETTVPDDDSLYPCVNNDIKYGLFEDIVDSYYLDSQIKDNFQCDHDCYFYQQEPMVDDHSNSCTHEYHRIAQCIQDLSDNTQQNSLHSLEENASLFADDTATPCDFNIINQHSDTENANDTNIPCVPKQSGIHSQRKHTYRNTLVNQIYSTMISTIRTQLTFTDKYMALLQQELQNPYWNLHNPITTKSYQISKDMDIDTMPHAMYFTGDQDTVTKINHVPCQTIVHNGNSMFTAKLMNDTPIEIFIDNRATPSILPLRTYNKFPILHTYPRTESNTPIHTGGGLIKSHFCLEIPLKLDHQTIQIKALVCDSECPYDLILGRTSMAWQDYASHKLTVRNNIRMLPGKTGIVSLTLQPNKTSFTPRHTITGKGVAYIKPLNSGLPLRPIEIEFENNRCCTEIHNTSDTTVEFLHGQEMAYFDARSKGLVQMNNSKHFQ